MQFRSLAHNGFGLGEEADMNILSLFDGMLGNGWNG